MEFVKRKLPIVLGVIIFVVLCVVGGYYLENGKSFYYTQIDNTKVKGISTSDMKYEYTLDCYKENGKKKTLKFKTSRELRETAFLKLEVLSVSGVHNWEEVQYDDLPDKVQEKYSKPE